MLETDYYKFLLKLDKKIYIDSHFLLDITNRCIFNCIYCYKKSRNSDILENNTAYLKTEEVIYVARELSKIGFKIVTISGGEPGLHPNLCKIVKEIRDKTKLKVCIFSSYLKKKYYRKN
ncbi:MAG: radical SAM protein [Candidatus Aenigmatarchaeota archaeon]